MVDHQRIDKLMELVERSGAKLIAVGDGRQLPTISPGGMFDRLATKASTAELGDVYRTSDPRSAKPVLARSEVAGPERALIAHNGPASR